jgi:hypothetical protein
VPTRAEQGPTTGRPERNGTSSRVSRCGSRRHPRSALATERSGEATLAHPSVREMYDDGVSVCR